MSWWARISVRHEARVLPSERTSGDLVGGAADDGLVEQRRRVGGCVGEVHVADGFLGQPGAEQFVVGVADTQAEQHPVRAAFVEAFGAGEQQLADPIQRIGLAATVAQRLVLHPAADRSTQRLPTRTTWNGSATRRV